MANIIVCYFSVAGNSKYQDLSDAIFKNGNNVLQWNIRNWKFFKDSHINTIHDFKADIIISYNNSFPKELLSTIKCPILVVDADNPEMFFNKEILSKNEENIYYLGYQTDSKNLYKKILNLDIPDEKYIFFPPATGFKNDCTIPQVINISFIGTNFYSNYENWFSSIDLKEKLLFNEINNIKKDYFFNPSLVTIQHNSIKAIISGQQRINYLYCLSDLGLEIYSNSDWKEEISRINIDVAGCYKNKSIETKADNQNLYNSSKIAINLSHPQATSSFSWRVPDIMASNSCLVMENKQDWHEIFGEYISKETKEAIIYHDQYDMREKCINLLKNEELRTKCAAECQYAIEQNGMWEHRLQKIEDLLKIRIISNPPSKTPFLNAILLAEVKTINKETEAKTTNKETQAKIQKKPRSIKLSLYGLLIFLHFTPLVGKILIKKKKIKKIIYKILQKSPSYGNNKW